MSAPPRAASLLLAALLISCVTAGVFWSLLDHDFTNFDDRAYVTENPHVRAGLTGESVPWAFTSFHASNWHPLTWLSHMADWQIHGGWPGGHHLTSLLLHLANALLLLLALDRMTGATWRSACVALLFAVHPLHVESVAWVAERKDVLSTLFWMLALLAWERHARAPSIGRYLAVAAALVLGLGAKPMLVTLPFVLLLLDYWPLGRWAGGAVGRRLVREKLPLLLPVIASSAVTWVAQRRGGAVTSLERIPLGQRLGNAVVSYGEYLWKALWPSGLAVHYPHPGGSLSPWKVLASGLALAAVTVLVARARRRAPYLLVGWLWYVGTLVPVIGLVQVGSQAMADRYTYVPLIGVFVMVAWGLPEAALLFPRRKAAVVVPALAVVALAALAVAARAQVGTWRDSMTLFEHALRIAPASSVSHNNLGLALFERRRLDEAIPHYEEAVRLRPNHASALSNLGLALVERGRSREAIPHAEKAARLDPDNPSVHNNLGMALAAEGRREEAIAHYREALRLDPDYAAARGNLGLALALEGRMPEAIREYQQAVRLDPGFAEAHNNLGLALAGEGRLDEALEQFEAAVRARPDYGRAHFNRAGALYLKGRYAEAWDAVRLARRHGFEPPTRFLETLAAKMPEPAG